MDKPRPCGCKGCRTCLICENTYGISKSVLINKDNGTYVYCPWCNKAWPGWDLNDYTKHPNHIGKSIDYPGIYIELDFLTENEEADLIKSVDNVPWDLSQSGRRKQNYGPKCNFKKRRLQLGNFAGFPKFSEFVQKKFESVPILKGYQTIEQCSLEYNPERGASIDPHIDDCWIWGERIITVNLLADSVLTMTRYAGNTCKYNLDCVEKYPSVLDEKGDLNKNDEAYMLDYKSSCDEQPVIRIPMPRRSLLIMYGAARYDWEHQVLREDIPSRRICLAYREFTPPYLPHGAKYELSRNILENSRHFFVC